MFNLKYIFIKWIEINILKSQHFKAIVKQFKIDDFEIKSYNKNPFRK